MGDSLPYLNAMINKYLNDDFSDLPDNVLKNNQPYLGYIRSGYLNGTLPLTYLTKLWQIPSFT